MSPKILPYLASVSILEVGHNLDDFTLGQDKRDHDETECGMKNVSPRRIIGMLAAWPYHSMEAGVTRGFSSAQATPEFLCLHALKDSQGLYVPA